ncbi:hypothetical protein B296_00038050 [Ensete ventricosum]|uniref:Uncharacterized protein n=1 Tax=Ensete ventricosum TaxID=4639 RepID=A0A426XAY3_ENSVE|nr:hypothetical protein B296_00038050 [Ensete ventricosum]
MRTTRNHLRTHGVTPRGMKPCWSAHAMWSTQPNYSKYQRPLIDHPQLPLSRDDDIVFPADQFITPPLLRNTPPAGGTKGIGGRVRIRRFVLLSFFEVRPPLSPFSLGLQWSS